MSHQEALRKMMTDCRFSPEEIAKMLGRETASVERFIAGEDVEFAPGASHKIMQATHDLVSECYRWHIEATRPDGGVTP